MARRGHGEGSIYQRKDGRWVASITLENRKRKYIYGDTRKEVQEKLKVALREQQQGTLITSSQQSMKQYLEWWVEQVYKPTVKISSYHQHRAAIKNHLVPALGHIPLQKLSASDVQSFYTQKLNAGYAPETIATYHTTLHSALENAVKWGLVSRNVAKLASLPRIEVHQGQTLTAEQAMALLDVAHESRIEAMLILAVTTGMRRGELMALHWDDVDFEQGAVYVRHTVSVVGGHGFVETEPKTKSSRRKIVLSKMALDALKEQRIRQEKVRSDAGEKWHERGLVFCTKYGGFLNPSHLLAVFRKLLARAGLPDMRFHDLRHSAATILLAAGVHPKMVQDRLGHSTISITMDVYSHVLPSMQQEVAKKIDELFKRP